MTPDIIALGIGLCFCMVLMAYGFQGAVRDVRLSRRLETIAVSRNRPSTDEPKQQRALEAALLCTGKDRTEIVAALRAAGYDPNGIMLFAALRMCAAFLSICIAYVYLTGTGHTTTRALLYGFAAGAAAFILSKVILRSRATARMQRVTKEIPFFLDMLLLMLESGVSLDQCIRYFAQTSIGGMELTRQAAAALVDDWQKGMSYDVAFDRWAARLGVSGTQELASLFVQSMLQGASLGPTLHDFMKEFSDKRLTAARASIGHKTTKLTVVMIVFLLPALMIVLAGPAVVAVQGAIGGLTP